MRESYLNPIIRKRVSRLAGVLRRFQITDRWQLGELLTRENLPNKGAFESRIAAHQEYLPTGVSPGYLADCILLELNRAAAGAGSAVDPNDLPLSIDDIDQLRAVPTGKTASTRYQNRAFRIVSAVFNGVLRLSRTEVRIDGGRKRIDITAVNHAGEGFFSQLRDSYGISAPQIPIECKNYSEDPSNPELDQLSGRLNPDQPFGILTTRDVADRNTLAQRCQSYCLKERKYIIVLDDKDLAILVNASLADASKTVDDLLNRRLLDTINGASNT